MNSYTKILFLASNFSKHYKLGSKLYFDIYISTLYSDTWYTFMLSFYKQILNDKFDLRNACAFLSLHYCHYTI